MVVYSFREERFASLVSSVFLIYRKNSVEFEEIWSDCITALQQLC